MLGTFTLWFGWYAFNAGSALITRSSGRDELAALAGVNTTLSGGMAGMVALFMNLLILELIVQQIQKFLIVHTHIAIIAANQ